MTDTWGSLDIEVVDDEIVVTAPFTSYTVTTTNWQGPLSFLPSTSPVEVTPAPP